MGEIFLGITVIICVAALISLVFRTLNQPAILAYILTGILITHFGFFNAQSQTSLQDLAEVGITLLLFMLGLEIKLSDLPTIGSVAAIVGTTEMVVTFFMGYELSQLLAFSPTQSMYISLAATFSSTILVVKLLADKKDLHSLYGKIAVGISLLQDVFAVLVLIFLSSFSLVTNSSLPLTNTIFALVLKGVLVVFIVWLLSRYVLPKLIHFAAQSSETLFLFSLAWVFGLAALVSSKYIGFTIEIGGLLAGLSMASLPENYQISARTKTLRDFFIILFFVVLGMQMSFADIGKELPAAIILSIFVLLGSPLLVMMFMGVLGYRKRTALFTGICLAQISEFSLIIIFLGNRLGQIQSDVLSLITLVAVITFATSTYLIVYNKKIYRILSPYLDIFERKNFKAEEMGDVGEMSGHIVLIGAHRMGESILRELWQRQEQLLVVDFNPDIVTQLKAKNITSLFGDITDTEIQERAQLHKAKLVISTIPDLEDNVILIKQLNKMNRRAKIVVMGQDREEAKILYKAGADYVVLPHVTGGRHVARILQGDHLKNIEDLKAEDFKAFL